jgi:hypothetical protein
MTKSREQSIDANPPPNAQHKSQRRRRVFVNATVSHNYKTTMKQVIILIIFATLISCGSHKTLKINSSNVVQIEIYQGYPGIKLQMKEGFEKEFIADLNKSKELSPTKYMKTHRILIHYTNKNIDTIYTNGNIHDFKNCYKSDENLIQKYSIKQNVLIDTIAGQIKTVEKLKKLMDENKYEEAVLLFSKEQQKSINDIKKEPEMFNYWCLAWTLDEAKYDRYLKKIKAGKGIFVFEDNEWKIDEK